MSIADDLKEKIKKTNVIYLGVDKSCDMAVVELNQKTILFGNFWDFHPGCHGHTFAFRGYQELVIKIKSYLESIGNSVTIKEDYNWKYED